MLSIQIEDYNDFKDKIDKFTVLKLKLDKINEFKNTEIQFENIDDLTCESATILLYLLEQCDSNRLITPFDSVVLRINCKQYNNQRPLLNFNCYIYEEESSIKYEIIYNEWYSAEDTNSFATENEIRHYVIEKCDDCSNKRSVTYDFDNQIHEKDSVFGDIAPLYDIDSKGGVGYWKFVKLIKGMIFPESVYRRFDITQEQKEKMLGCSHAFEEGTPYNRNKIERIRKMSIDPITGIVKAATYFLYRHCTYFTPVKPECKIAKLPAQMEISIDGKKSKITGNVGNIESMLNQITGGQ